MIDHVGWQVADFPASRRFYTEALAPLGLSVVGEGEGWAMLGRDGRALLWFGSLGAPAGHLHAAFTASSRAEVEAFHAAGLAAGGRDNGPPGLRPQYHAGYYAAFVLDPEGRNIEAVFHDTPG